MYFSNYFNEDGDARCYKLWDQNGCNKAEQTKIRFVHFDKIMALNVLVKNGLSNIPKNKKEFDKLNHLIDMEGFDYAKELYLRNPHYYDTVIYVYHNKRY